MLLSVIIPCYNFEKYIEQCVNSVLCQETDFDFEVLIGDDCSSDGSLRVILDLFGQDPRVKIFVQEQNTGGFNNIKNLLEKSQGKYISYLDGDDYFTDPKKLARQVDFLEKNLDFSMHCTGYRGINEIGDLIPTSPDGSLWFSPIKDVLDFNDLAEKNLVTFGRTFRNVQGILKPWIEKCAFLDWAMNFEISLLGKIKCENNPSGIYRFFSGMFSGKTEDEKSQMEQSIRKILKRRLVEEKIKSQKVTIVDCFIRNKRIEEKLITTLKNLRDRQEKILLVTNSEPDKRVSELCDFVFFDRRNQLFVGDYSGVKMVDFHISLGDFTIHNIKPGLQRHGLSVLINLRNAVRLAKILGFRYFQRLEADDLFGKKSFDQFEKLLTEVIEKNKKSCFYFNEDEKNVSFHYFLSEIDFFLESVSELKNEEDYRDYLMLKKGNLDFMIAEEFIYAEVSKKRDQILEKDGGKMFLDFSDTVWNTETSGSNLDSKFENCLTGIYKIKNSEGRENGFAVMSYNYGEQKKQRKIICTNEQGEELFFDHALPCQGSWSYNLLPQGFNKIEVYQGEEKIYTETIDKTISYLQF